MRQEQQDKLSKPFELHEHAFKGKNAYIKKSAIRRRLFEIDARWTLTQPEFVCIDGDVVIMRGGLTVCGITRYQIGSGIVQRKDSNGKVLEGYDLALMVAKAYKEAASAILSRAAVEFNCGAYLKDLDKDEKPKDMESLKRVLAKLTADPNAWTAENVAQWVEKWLAKDLTEAQLFKALGITDKYREFKGTVAEADKAVEAFIELSKLDKPAQPKSVTEPNAIPLQKIDCPTHLLETNDVVIQEYKTSGSGPAETRYLILKNWGMVDGGRVCRLEVKTLATGKCETVQWTGSDRTLCDGPKVKAFAKDPDCCLPARAGGRPQWNRQIAEPVRV